MGKNTERNRKRRKAHAERDKKMKAAIAVAAAPSRMDGMSVPKVAGSGRYISSTPVSKAMLKQAIKGSGGYASSLVDTVSGIARPVAGVIDTIGSLLGFGSYKSRAKKYQAAYEKTKNTESLFSSFPELDAANTNAPLDTYNPGKMGAANATFASSGSGSLISHREFVRDVVGSSAFATTPFDLNPGATLNNSIAPIAPWVAEIARGFQQYRIRGMILEYVPSMSAYTTSGQLGSVYMSTIYDADQEPLSGEQAVADQDYTTTNIANKALIHPIECAPGSNALTYRYIDNSDAVSSADPRWNDYGTFQVSTVGQPSELVGLVIGKLYVTYLFEFCKPQLQTTIGSSYYGASINSSTDAVPTVLHNPNSTLSLVTIPGAGVVAFRFPPGLAGSFILLMTQTDQSGSAFIPDIALGPGVNVLNYFSHTSTFPPVSFQPGASTASGGQSLFSYAVTTTGSYDVADPSAGTVTLGFNHGSTGFVTDLTIVGLPSIVSNIISLSDKKKSLTQQLAAERRAFRTTPVGLVQVPAQPGLWVHPSDVKFHPSIDYEASLERRPILRTNTPSTVHTSAVFGYAGLGLDSALAAVEEEKTSLTDSPVDLSSLRLVRK